ncbi:peroxide/acid stress response protein YhcN [Hafnia paralvei]|uniref:peroxide/acid stress response protein YhcN n=1 Tax=Hafnia paralvei TaxID=546367 RepID=UPI0026737538|nr:peroxide/acid stress response protein YhcN [Hafnia paralvei]
MKIKTTVAALGLLSMVSFGAFSAQSISAEQASSMQSLGTITTSGIDGSPSDIKAQLSDKADAKGATAYHIIEARIDGNYHATAEIYR